MHTTKTTKPTKKQKQALRNAKECCYRALQTEGGESKQCYREAAEWNTKAGSWAMARHCEQMAGA